MNFYSTGQNLVSNGDFESYSALPSNYGDFCLVTGWINPSGCCVLNPNFGTPDYVNSAAVWPVGAPNNGFGTITPRSGSGIVGFTTYATYGTPPVFREYIAKKLNNPLVIGQSYSVSFYIARATNPYFKYATNNIGVHFSTTAPLQTGTAVMPVTPQWEYTSVFSSTSWTLMSFNYIATDTFNYITIGNFRSDAATAKSVINNSATGLYAHYFVDDVSVTFSSPLPVEWLSFDVRNLNSKVEIMWTTASENSNAYFTIERSIELQNFMEIGKIQGCYNSTTIQTYKVYDENPIKGISYYRIRQTDGDGQFSFSESKVVFRDEFKHPEVRAWFDGIGKKIRVAISNTGPNESTLILFDLSGKIFNLPYRIVSDQFEYDAASIPNGIYMIRVNMEDKIFVRKIIRY